MRVLVAIFYRMILVYSKRQRTPKLTLKKFARYQSPLYVTCAKAGDVCATYAGMVAILHEAQPFLFSLF